MINNGKFKYQTENLKPAGFNSNMLGESIQSCLKQEVFNNLYILILDKWNNRNEWKSKKI